MYIISAGSSAWIGFLFYVCNPGITAICVASVLFIGFLVALPHRSRACSSTAEEYTKSQ